MESRALAVALSAALLLCCGQSAGAEKLNQLMVKYGLIPKMNSFFDIPRTISDAMSLQDNWGLAANYLDSKGYSVWCRNNNYRVCPLYDLQGSVTGIQVSHSLKDLAETGVPQDFSTIPDWSRNNLLGVDVYTATAYFVDPSTLPFRGRVIDKDTDTAEGIWIEQANAPPMKIPFHDSDLAATTKYTKQGCLPGQGQHYFYNLTKSSGCEERGPYFMLYEKSSGTMLGVGVIIFGNIIEPKNDRQWFLHPPYIVAPLVTPNGPKCTEEWMKRYGSTSLHVFFRKDPWFISCLW